MHILLEAILRKRREIQGPVPSHVTQSRYVDHDRAVLGTPRDRRIRVARRGTWDDGTVCVEKGDVIWGLGDERWSLGGFCGGEFGWKRNMVCKDVLGML